MPAECSISCSASLPACPWHNKLLMFLGVTGAACVISLGGLASVQDLTASDSATFGPVTQPSGKWRYPWFIIAWEIVILLIISLVVLAGALKRARLLCVGLMAVATLLYIQFSNMFLNESQAWSDDVQKDRLYTTVAGGIITATFNALAVVLLGWDCRASCPAYADKPCCAAKAACCAHAHEAAAPATQAPEVALAVASQ